MVERSPINDPGMAEVQKFPFSRDFQLMAFRLILDDPGFAVSVHEYLQPGYFENEMLVWAYAYCQRYFNRYRQIPSLAVLFDAIQELDITARPLYTAVLEKVREVRITDEAWLRDQINDFIRRNVFVRSFRQAREQYNQGDINGSYETFLAAADKIRAVGLATIERSFFFEDFGARHAARMQFDPMADVITTGFRWIDGIMGGGLSKGELGCWVGYAKRGKSTLLINHGVAAIRGNWSNVLHCVFEGMHGQTEARYDAAFSNALYSDMKMGNVDDQTYQALTREYEYLKQKLVVRSFLSGWDYTAVDIHNELKTLKRDFDWTPDLIIVDYGDLLTGREKHYSNPTQAQKAAFRDLKTLANNGYGIWTASQAQRPNEKDEQTEHLLKSRKIADAYEKVRICDFLGSINVTDEEFKQGMARLYAELYRDNAANKWARVHGDFDRMRLYQTDEEPVSGSVAELQQNKPVITLQQQGIPIV